MAALKKDNEPNLRAVRGRNKTRRKEDMDLIEKYKQENERLRLRNAALLVPRTEQVLWYASMVLGLSVIFGWHVILTL